MCNHHSPDKMPQCSKNAATQPCESLRIRNSWRRPHILVARILVRTYRYTLSALIGRSCRYFPTCSEYTEAAIVRFGLWAGFWIGLARILRCHPWGASGWDPIPEQLPPDSRWYLPWRYGRWTGAHIADRM
ncbi:membrane protein insertion efficiency factor YidD [Siculibacillus lacustris]|uniref:Putative membrane protein insertion efficiency factor n=2 Tax=Siculibacillus lacustris TaxID=1549641 RepID=A0A4Q9VG40_9HYPH|nr:membrane protein insertion efficiency factor YidD [Siculibacillus lacustris]TBW33091.1 membrane protein insertion efficiency factor YidD [Siculibacillus lacustris]